MDNTKLNPDAPEPHPDYERVRKMVGQLSEHFDTVQVFVTKYGPEGQTINIHLGSGNWFARYGQIREWIIKREENAKIEVHNDNEDRDEE